tara:strand:+ start:464 stop:1054 length:591 start_codon:yes stop_codon:yes gene_type:complete
MSKTVPDSVKNLRRIWNEKKNDMSLNQTSAAKGLGWTQGAFSQYLNNITELGPRAIIKIANFLEVDPREIDPLLQTVMPNMRLVPVRSSVSRKPHVNSVYLDMEKRNAYQFAVVVDKAISIKLSHGPLALPIGTILMCFSEKETTQEDINSMTVTALPALYTAYRKNAAEWELFEKDTLPPKKDLEEFYRISSIVF